MAQTKRKRRSKHRGTAAGTIEARGRTGRRPADGERPAAKGKGGVGARAAGGRGHRLDQPPTWRSAALRALVAGAFLFVVSVLLLRRTVAEAAVIVPFAVLLYIPSVYYMDRFFHRRRAARAASAKAAR